MHLKENAFFAWSRKAHDNNTRWLVAFPLPEKNEYCD
jgi:hypothetical protein